MQQTGSLKKRRSRNLAKVTGLSIKPYEAEKDNFTGASIYELYIQAFTNKTQQSNKTNVTNHETLSGEPCNPQITNPKLNDTRSQSTIRRVLQQSINLDKQIKKIQSKTCSIEHHHDVDLEANLDLDINEENHSPDPQQKRPYLLNGKTMLRLRQLLILGMTSGAFPWSWNETENRIDKWTAKNIALWQIMWALTTVQTCILTIFQIYTFFGSNMEEKSYREIFMMSFSFYWYFCAVAFNINLYIYKEQIREFINTLLFMNKKYVDRYLINADDYVDSGGVLINLSIPTNISQVFISVSLFLRVPWEPWYLYSYIYSDDNPVYWLIPGALQEFMVVGQVITSYMLICWIIVAHANSVNFWLKEAHNGNETGFTIDTLRDPNHALRIYRSMQILCANFNDCMSPLAIPMVKVHVWTGIIPTGFVIIRSLNQLFFQEFPGILTYPCSVLDCVTGGFAILSIGAEMYDLGISFIDSWSRTKQKDFRRILMSCKALRVKVGGLYKVEVSTTRRFFKSAVDYIVDCIVTFP